MYSSIELQPNESVLQEIRRARMTLSPGLMAGSFIVLANFFLLAWWFQHDPWGPLVFAMVLVLGALVLVRTIVLWRRNMLVITNQRVIYFQQSGLFEHTATEVGYDKIQDIRYTIKGIIHTMYHIGTITLQTAGLTNVISADRLEHPMQVQRLIAEQQRRFTQQRPAPVAQRNVLDIRTQSSR